MKPRFPSETTPHLFTVDVEEHFQVSAFEDTVSRESWESHPSRVVRNTEVLLELLEAHRAGATFFVLGWVAERWPELVRRIADAGHEIASHGWWHYRVNRIDRTRLRDEVRRSKALLEDQSGKPVDGFRAPSFSITPGFEWAFDVLIEEGYRYDSSLFPVRRPGYGYPSSPRWHHRIDRAAGSLLEFPMATLRLGPIRLPAAGGGYLRHLPFSVVRGAFREAGRNGKPGMFYVHPWEVDPGQPRLPVGAITTLRHYRGLEKTLPRLRALLAEFRFTSVRAWREANQQ